MPLFLGFHKTVGPIDEERIHRGWGNYKKTALKLSLKPLYNFYNASLGIGYCITEAPSKKIVIKAHSNINMTLEEITEVKMIK